MHLRALNSWIRTPLLLLTVVEAAVLFSSLYVAALVTCGSVANCELLAGPLAPKALLMTSLVVGGATGVFAHLMEKVDSMTLTSLGEPGTVSFW